MAEQKTQKLIASNPSAFTRYSLEEVVEAGIALTGTEVKSIRAQSPTLKDCWVEVTQNGRKMEAWLMAVHIPPYSHGNIANHEPERKRKLLMHRHQIEKIFGSITRDGRTAIATRMYFTKGRIKVEIAIAKGKKTQDRRQEIESRSAERDIQRALRRSQKGR